MLRITSPAAWLALGGLLLLVFASLVWAVNGRIPVEIPGKGFLVPLEGVTRARSLTSGILVSVDVKAGDRVGEGQQLALFRPTTVEGDPSSEVPAVPEVGRWTAGAGLTAILSPCEGIVLQVHGQPGAWLEQGSGVVSVTRGTSSSLRAWLYVPFEKAGEVEPGMTVTLDLDSAPSEDHGFLEGRVYEVGKFPADGSDIRDAFGPNTRWNDYFLGADPEPMARVVVDLVPDETPTGYHWTMGDGPPKPLLQGSIFTGAVQVDTIKPLTLALP